MRCPKCKNYDTKVIDSRIAEDSTSIRRRRECEKCGKEYHVLFLPPKESGVCDKCGGALIQRDDDKETTIARRLKIYEEQTKPLIDFYKNEGVLKDINALGGKEEVFSRIKGSLGN